MTFKTMTLRTISLGGALAVTGTAQAHSGADAGTFAAMAHAWLHSGPAGGVILAGVALAGFFLVRRTLASRR